MILNEKLFELCLPSRAPYMIDGLNSHISLCQKSSPLSQGRKTPSGRGRTYDLLMPYKEKAVMVQKQKRKRAETIVSLGKCVWLSGRMHV